MRHRTGAIRRPSSMWLTLCGLLLAASPASGDSLFARCDFNGDGIVDTAIGAPYESYQPSDPRARGAAEAGAVDVVYGVKAGDTAIKPQHWTLASTGVPGVVSEGDHLGYAVAWGWFNDDYYSDLAIGIPGRDVDGIEDAGSVLILYGSPSGLVATGPALVVAPRLLVQASGGVPGTPQYGDNFGFSLATGVRWGDPGFNHYLAIGAPGVTAGDKGDRGRGKVVVIYHAHEDLNQLFMQVVGTPEPGDWFGFSLAAGYFGGFGTLDADLAIGVPGEDVDGADNAGAVEVLYNNRHFDPTRLSTEGALLLRQQTFLTTTQSGSFFGLSLAAGNLTIVDNEYSGFEYPDELIIGEPMRKVGSAVSAGVVHVIEGSPYTYGLDLASAHTIWPGRFIAGGRLIGTSEAGDWFGYSVAVSDDLLAIGSPGKFDGKGSVHFLQGTYTGATAEGAQVLYGNVADAQLGWSVEAGADRVVAGAPGTLAQAGAVRIYTRNAAGPFVGAGTWTQDSIFGASEPTEPGDGFGFSVGAGGLPWIKFKF